jgi:hypothetical protein
LVFPRGSGVKGVRLQHCPVALAAAPRFREHPGRPVPKRVDLGIIKAGPLGPTWAFYNGGNRWTYGVYLYKAAKQFGMKFRLSWHWNAAAGDPLRPRLPRGRLFLV